MSDLTPREREMALLAAEGLTNRQIAEALCVEETTVKGTLSRAMRKVPETRTKRRRERLAVWLYRQEQNPQQR